MNNRQDWKKLGLIFCASKQNPLMFGGARAPVSLYIADDRFRIYFGSMDEEGHSRIFSLELDLKNPQEIHSLVTQPILDLGAMGFFDDNGISPSDVLRVDNKIYLYTIGFSIKNSLMFDAAIGLATSVDEGMRFNRLNGPILDRGLDDPCFATSPAVIKDERGWRMWYVSGERWLPHENGFRHFYNIKHRFSSDGIHWEPHVTVCIDFANDFEYAISRPYVLRDSNGLYRMWYSYRAQPTIASNRIGYAESNDGLKWRRMDDQVNLDVSAEGWDSEMVCYPCVFVHKDKLYMLYNGNGYGKSGFGLAVLEE